jgi:hypothetical protein
MVMPANRHVEGIVLRTRTFFRVKYEIYDWAMTALVHCFLVGDVGFGEAGLLVLS